MGIRTSDVAQIGHLKGGVGECIRLIRDLLAHIGFVRILLWECPCYRSWYLGFNV